MSWATHLREYWARCEQQRGQRSPTTKPTGKMESSRKKWVIKSSLPKASKCATSSLKASAPARPCKPCDQPKQILTKITSEEVQQEVDTESPPFNSLARQPLFHIAIKILGMKTSALIDSGASDNFISSKLVRMIACPIHKLKQNFPVHLGYGSPLVVDSFVRI